MEKEIEAKQVEVDDTVKVKTIKITSADFKKIETILKDELSKRKSSLYRTGHVDKWKEVDRQVVLDPMETLGNVEETWLATFELGTLSKASEIMTADILRVIFPEMRSWFESHVEIEPDLDPKTGNEVPVDKKFQDQVDGRLRALMTQQHVDFGLSDRVELSIKESLHHGAFVVEVVEDSMDMYFDGTSIKEISSPVWKPHSMHNCFPDPSPSLVGTNMFYTGSMFIRQYMPRHKFLEQAIGEGWIPKNLKKIPREEHEDKENRTKDVELVYYWGDVIIPKGEAVDVSVEDMFLPHHKAILANGKLVYLDSVKTPYLPIIYKTYEKMDVRDPYGISPIIKQSPMQKITSILANEFVNGIQLHTRPAIVYDGNDPDFVVNGGPVIAPGAKTSTKGSANFKEIVTGDPQAALSGLEFGISSMKESLGRPGIDVGDRATKEEVVTKQADSEAGPFGFAVKMDQALRAFLYMQHAMNLAKKDFKYSYYNPEIDSPDFLRATKKDLPDTVNFEVVGTKGVLGEARRHQAFIQTTAFLSGNPLFAPLLEPEEIAKQVYTDAGIKNAERFLKQGDIPADLKAKMDGMMGAIQKLQSALKDEQAETQLKTNKMTLDYQAKEDKIKAQHERDLVHLAEKQRSESADQTNKINMARMEIEAMLKDHSHKMQLSEATKSAKSSEPSRKADVESSQTLLTELKDIVKDEKSELKELKDDIKELTKVIAKPKIRKVVRDEKGRATHSVEEI